MSWMDVRGTIYHCLRCRTRVPVEYEGGRRLTQVGDIGVLYQRRQAARYGGPEDYLHEEGLCHGCVNSLAQRTARRPAALLRMMRTLAPRGALVQRQAHRPVAARIAKLHADLNSLAESLQKNILDAIREHAGDWLERLTPSELRSIDPSAYSATLEMASRDSAPGKILKLARSYLKQSNNALEGMLRQRLQQTARLAEMEEEYARRVAPLIDAFTALIEELPLEIAGHGSRPEVLLFIPKDTSATESLNPFIEYEATVRQPVGPGAGTFFVSSLVAQTELEGMARMFRLENVTSVIKEVLAKIIARCIILAVSQ